MLPTDLSTLRDRLAELAEVFERKPAGDKAIRVWFDVLREFACEDVASFLIAWPKTHGKFPTPAEVWKLCSERTSARLERQAEMHRKEPTFHPGVGGAKAEEFIARMRETLKKPKFTPLEHWRRVQQSGSAIGKEFADAALEKMQPSRREPGEDEEEKSA